MQKISPLNDKQREYFQTIQRSTITLCDGPAGTGKSFCGVYQALVHLLDARYGIEKIIITKPIIESGSSIGLIPGTVEEKTHQYFIPIWDEINFLLNKKEKDSISKQLDMAPLQYMRGRTFINTFALLTEAQNATMEQMKLFLTRIGEGSKFVIEGDVNQSDLPKHAQGAFQKCLDCLQNVNGIGITQFTDDDIVRHSLISEILKRLQ